VTRRTQASLHCLLFLVRLHAAVFLQLIVQGLQADA
jgi:hypothetical protein